MLRCSRCTGLLKLSCRRGGCARLTLSWLSALLPHTRSVAGLLRIEQLAGLLLSHELLRTYTLLLLPLLLVWLVWLVGECSAAMWG